MDSETTRDLVQRFLDARAADDTTGVEALLADDASWQPPPSMGLGPFNGREEVAKALTSGRIFEPGSVRREVVKLLADGDTAVAIQRLSATTKRGVAYDNEYCWVYTCRDGKIARLDEYVDSYKAAKVFGMVKS